MYVLLLCKFLCLTSAHLKVNDVPHVSHKYLSSSVRRCVIIQLLFVSPGFSLFFRHFHRNFTVFFFFQSGVAQDGLIRSEGGSIFAVWKGYQYSCIPIHDFHLFWNSENFNYPSFLWFIFRGFISFQQFIKIYSAF